MNIQDVLDLPLMDLYKVSGEIHREIERKKKQLIDSVIVDGEHLKHSTGTFLCRNVAYRGRWRMWRMIPGKRGLKRGPVVVHEHMGDLDDLRIKIALGHYKEG